jgi:hypothetical protein
MAEKPARQKPGKMTLAGGNRAMGTRSELFASDASRQPDDAWRHATDFAN